MGYEPPAFSVFLQPVATLRTAIAVFLCGGCFHILLLDLIAIITSPLNQPFKAVKAEKAPRLGYNLGAFRLCFQTIL